MSEPNHSVERHHRDAHRRPADRKAGTFRAPCRATPRTQEVDRHVSARIRTRRVMLGLTQTEFADLLGVSIQQVQKYERGINRISAGRLFEIAQAASWPIEYFFDGLDEAGKRPINGRERMCVEFVRTVGQVLNRSHQEALSQLVRTLASG